MESKWLDAAKKEICTGDYVWTYYNGRMRDGIVLCFEGSWIRIELRSGFRLYRRPKQVLVREKP